jgi:hypothetical protein
MMRSKIWIGVGLAVAAGSYAAEVVSPTPAAAVQWLVADNATAAAPGGEGGEGGEAGTAAAEALSDAQLAERIAELSAHLWLAKTLVGQADAKAGADVMTHALESLYPKVAPALAERKIASLEAALKGALESAQNAIKGGAFDGSGLEGQLKAADATLTPQGNAAVAHDASIIAGLAKSAAVEYGEAIIDGTLKELPEFRFASAFVHAAMGRFKHAETGLKAKDAVAAADLADGLSALGASLNSLDALPAGRLTPAQFSAIASRLELKASRFR